MSLKHSPGIVTSNLLFSIDGSNPRSFKGKPTTNLYADGDFALGVNHPVWSGNYTYIPDPTNTAKQCLKISPRPGNVQYFGRDITGVVGTAYSFQLEMYVSPDWDGTDCRLYGEQGAGGMSASYNLSAKGTWQKLTYNNFLATGTTMRVLIYMLSASTTGYVLCRNLQVEQGTFVTPFTVTSRTATNSVIDLTNSHTLTINSLTYNSNNTYQYSNSANNSMYVSTASSIGTLPNYTINYWCKRSAAGQMAFAANSGTSFYCYGDNSYFYTHGGVSGEYYFPRSVSIPLNTYGMWTYVYNGSNVSIYRNGVFEGSQATTGTANWGSAGIKIGGWQGGASYAFDGEIPIVQFYSKALTAAEVTRNYIAHKGRFGL